MITRCEWPPSHSQSCRGHDGLVTVRAELCERLAALRAIPARAGSGDLLSAVTAIRRTAAAYGLTPVVRIAEALERAPMGAAGRRTADLYLDRLNDAIGCQRVDDAASEAMLASVSVRLGA